VQHKLAALGSDNLEGTSTITEYLASSIPACECEVCLAKHGPYDVPDFEGERHRPHIDFAAAAGTVERGALQCWMPAVVQVINSNQLERNVAHRQRERHLA
jgi:hypothetical protein